jgi:23S rRNA pseudouridine955/2504/2580 synthase
MIIELKAGPDDAGRRLDRILRKSLPQYSLSLIHRLLRQGKVTVNGKTANPNDRISSLSLIQLTIETPVNHADANHRLQSGNKKDTSVNNRHELVNKERILVKYRSQRVNKKDGMQDQSSVFLPEIIWRGSGIIVFNKPSGLASHGKNSLDTLVKTWLIGKIKPSLSFKPGPLHRLDQSTSGAIAFSESLEGARWFSRLLRERKVSKTYLAIVEGKIIGDEVWRDNLVRNKTIKKTFIREQPTEDEDCEAKYDRNAVTVIKALASNGSYTLIEARIITGRTHQIRAQAASHGHPLVGDKKYGRMYIRTLPFPAQNQHYGFYLHSWKMEPEERIEGFPQPLIAPIPEEFLLQIKLLFTISAGD